MQKNEKNELYDSIQSLSIYLDAIREEIREWFRWYFPCGCYTFAHLKCRFYSKDHNTFAFYCTKVK